MKVLFIVLVLCTLALVAVGIAMFWRVRRHMKQTASDTMLRAALKDVEEENQQIPK